MSVLDQRTRFDRDATSVPLSRFLEIDAPLLLARNGELAGRGARVWELPPLALDVAGEVVSFVPLQGGMRIEAGIANGAVVAELDAESFSEWVQVVADRVLPRRGGVEGDEADRELRGLRAQGAAISPRIRASSSGAEKKGEWLASIS